MSENFFPFPSVNGDRKYGVSDWVGYFAPLITNGVFGGGDKLKVTAGTGLTVSVAAGEACINGYRYTNTTPKTLTLAAANAYYARIDRVIVRWDKQARTMTAQVLTGEPSSAPVAPSLIRTAVVYDICLATVTVPANATAAGTITDTREDKTVCGTVSLLLQIDADSVTPALIGAEPAKMVFTTKTVAKTDWAGDQTYASYPYRAAIPLSGVTDEMLAEVILAPDNAASGEFAAVNHTYNGGVYIYSASAPSVAITIPTIIVWGANL